MIWLGLLSLLLAAAVAAAWFGLRRVRREPPPAASPPQERRSAPAVPAPAAQAGIGERLRSAVARQRERAGRLTAGHVQLIDVGAMIEGAAAVGLSPAKALRAAEEVARRMTRANDVLIRIEPDGIAILFDGVDRQGAEDRSRAIAAATLAALGEVGAGGRYIAEGFGYELDEVMEGAVIDSVDDLVRFIHIAHRAYVARERGVARQLGRDVNLVRRAVRSGDGRTVVGHEIAAFRSILDGGQVGLVDESFTPLAPALGAETDCVVLEKLVAAVAPVLGESVVPVYVPMRLSSLINPLYLDNVRAALDALPPALRQRLVPVVDAGVGTTRSFLPRGREVLRTRVAAIAVRIADPGADVAAAAAAGATIVVLDAPERRFRSPLDAVTQFRELSLNAGLDPILFAAGTAVLDQRPGLAFSRTEAG